MSEEIKRYDWNEVDGVYPMDADGDGEYVLYADHLSQLAALREELSRMTEGRDGLRLALDEANKIIAWQRDDKPDLARLADAERRNADITNAVMEAFAHYERCGEVCTFEGMPMIHASTLTDIADICAALNKPEEAKS